MSGTGFERRIDARHQMGVSAIEADADVGVVAERG